MRNDIDILVDNEREWRKYILKKIDKIDDDMDKLKVKVAVISAFFGSIGALIVALVSR